MHRVDITQESRSFFRCFEYGKIFVDWVNIFERAAVWSAVETLNAFFEIFRGPWNSTKLFFR